MRLSPLACLSLAVSTIATLPAQQPVQRERPKVALVLGGGGARGLAHLGVIDVLEAQHVPVDFVVGTSIGALVGGLYAAGWSPEELHTLVATTDWVRVFDDKPPRGDLSFRRKRDSVDYLIKLTFGWRDGGLTLPPGLLSGQNVRKLLDRATLRAWQVDDFDDLPIPFRCVAANLADGSRVVFEAGNLAAAMRASMSIPGVFSPAVVDGMHLVDGGIVENLPVSVAKALGADVVIAIDVGTPLVDVARIASVLDVTNQVAGIMMRQNYLASLELLDDDDLLLTVPLEEVSTMDFAESERAIAEGRAAAAAIVDRLRELAVDDATWSDWLARQRRPYAPPMIDRVVIRNDTDLNDAILEHRVRQHQHAPLDVDQLDADVDSLTGLELLESVTYSVEQSTDDGEADSAATQLIIDATERDWGPHYLRFGIGLASDFRGDNDFDVAVQHTWAPANGRNGEWRNELRVGSRNLLQSSFFQPLDAGLSWFVEPSIELGQRVYTFVEDGRNFADADARWFGGDFAVGRVLGNWGEMRVLYERVEGSAKPNFGVLGSLPRFAIQDAACEARLTIDTLDSLSFPRHGVGGFARVRYGNEDLGASDEYSVAEANLLVPISFGELTLAPRVRCGWSIEESEGPTPQFLLGGFLNLSGFRPDELVGRYVAYASLLAYYRLSRPATRFSSSMFVGASIETGATWLTQDAIDARDLILAGSAFFGMDTVIGPIYTAFGAAEYGNLSGYIYIGVPF